MKSASWRINSYIITWTNITDPRPPNNKMWSFKESFLVLILALVSSVRLARAQRIGNDNNIIMSGCASCVLIQYYIPMSRFGDESILHQPGRVQCESLQLCHPNDKCVSPRRHLLQVVHRVSAIYWGPSKRMIDVVLCNKYICGSITYSLWNGGQCDRDRLIKVQRRETD